ncbi:zinc finger protein-like 1 [Dinothrombium tinctorium]|uniref:Zinc finger protein-like 1 homolog n=1 Tax=Dinothrombium tinctorium TaxID=1965070 RepID=A0A443RR51_9ACAR|nr:zinc finger protein-like 1 [Dinothrombium tinctorium]
MGLCKCPKKKVTQHFCFEHKVNVCEFCMVSDHPKCVVGPYLNWLEDDSFTKVCSLCRQDLANDECIRLLCYHVFHWPCLNRYASDMPSNTAPAGYTCPDCHKPIFPPSSAANTPVSLNLRKLLSTVEWARVGLGLPIVENNRNSLIADDSNVSNYQRNVPQIIHHNPVSSTTPIPVNNVSSFINSSSDSFTISSNPRKVHESEVRFSNNSNAPLLDIDEDKYRNKSPMEFLSRWFRSHGAFSRQRNSYRRWIIVGILAFIALCTIIHYFLKMGRLTADNDPLLDPNFNPNIRVEENNL